jgi:hypothetical protein
MAGSASPLANGHGKKSELAETAMHNNIGAGPYPQETQISARKDITDRSAWLKDGYQTHPLACPYIIILYIK